MENGILLWLCEDYPLALSCLVSQDFGSKQRKLMLPFDSSTLLTIILLMPLIIYPPCPPADVSPFARELCCYVNWLAFTCKTYTLSIRLLRTCHWGTFAVWPSRQSPSRHWTTRHVHVCMYGVCVFFSCRSLATVVHLDAALCRPLVA